MTTPFIRIPRLIALLPLWQTGYFFYMYYRAVFKNSMGLHIFEATQLARTRQLFLRATPIMGTKRYKKREE